MKREKHTRTAPRALDRRALANTSGGEIGSGPTPWIEGVVATPGTDPVPWITG